MYLKIFLNIFEMTFLMIGKSILNFVLHTSRWQNIGARPSNVLRFGLMQLTSILPQKLFGSSISACLVSNESQCFQPQDNVLFHYSNAIAYS